MSVHVITGYGPDGRSTVISTQEKTIIAADGFSQVADVSGIQSAADKAKPLIVKLHESDKPGIFPRPASGHLLPIATPPHGLLWLEMKFEGHYETEFHRTESIDFHYVIAGEVELILEDGSVSLRAGDTVMLPGVVHRWRSERLWHSNLLAFGLEAA